MIYLSIEENLNKLTGEQDVKLCERCTVDVVLDI